MNRKISDKRYYEKNKAERLKKNRAYYSKNKERWKKYNAKYLKGLTLVIDDKYIASEKRKAREVANGAVKSGKIRVPKRCDQCGKIKKLEMHHENYGAPLYITWLCNTCHRGTYWL